MPKLLIVEDEILVACYMQGLLEDDGHAVIGIAPDARSVEKHLGRTIDLALVDLNLRDGLTGPDIGMRLHTMGVPVLFVTANPAMVADKLDGKFECCIGIVPKPTDEQVLRNAVSYALRRSGGENVDPPRGVIAR